MTAYCQEHVEYIYGKLFKFAKEYPEMFTQLESLEFDVGLEFWTDAENGPAQIRDEAKELFGLILNKSKVWQVKIRDFIYNPHMGMFWGHDPCDNASRRPILYHIENLAIDIKFTDVDSQFSELFCEMKRCRDLAGVHVEQCCIMHPPPYDTEWRELLEEGCVMDYLLQNENDEYNYKISQGFNQVNLLKSIPEWSPDTHHMYPKKFRDLVVEVLLLWNHDQYEHGECDDFPWNMLPLEVVLRIVRHLASQWVPFHLKEDDWDVSILRFKDDVVWEKIWEELNE